MKRCAPYGWWWFCILVFCLLGSSALLAQQAPDAGPLVFDGTLGGRDSSRSEATHYVNINAGDQITANAICALNEDDLRPIDPKLYIYAPRGAGSQEREEWVDDDNTNVSACFAYRSSQIIFEAPLTGEYKFLIKNLATRSGPYRLEIIGSTASQDDDDTRTCEGGQLLSQLGEIGCVFSSNYNGGRRINVYGVDSNSVGYHVLTVYTGHLGAAPGSETLVASGHGGMFQVYHRPNGDLRITGGPNPEGKIFEVIVSGMPGAQDDDNNGLTTMSTTTVMATPTPEPASLILAVHVVQPGETLYSIASQYDVTVQDIVDANGIGADYVIHAGNRLNIPAP